MSNSPLVKFTRLSPNNSGKRNHAIDTISIHCMAGNMTIESCGALFASGDTQASSNYGVGSDGRVGLYVDEANRSWCTSNSANDNRAVTIEVANTVANDPWPVSDAAYAALIDLVTDICRRNGIKKLLWQGDKSLIGQVDKQNMTVHRWFAAKACPGDWLYERHGEIATEVNKRLGMTATESTPEPETAQTGTGTFKVNDLVEITGDTYYTGKKAVPKWVKALRWRVMSVAGDRVVINLSEDGSRAIRSPVKASDLRLVSESATEQEATATEQEPELTGAYTMGNSNEATIANFLKQVLRLNAAGICGCLANLRVESNFNPAATGDGGTSYGICQWHASRFSSLKTWCAQNGKDYKTLDGQLWYLKFELEGNYAPILSYLRSVPNTALGAYNAGYRWCLKFEIPADTVANSERRGISARDTYWPEYSGEAPATAEAPAAQSEFPPYIAKVTAAALNVRREPSTESPVTMLIRDKGCYTIVEVSGEWGKLKSGVGWIKLCYTTPI